MYDQRVILRSEATKYPVLKERSFASLRMTTRNVLAL